MSNQSMNQLNDNELWQLANQQLMARALSELVYEQELEVKVIAENTYSVSLNNDIYQFVAKKTVWDYLSIKPETLSRNGVAAFDALQLCLELKQCLGVDDIVGANWLEEVQNTLANEYERMKHLNQYSAADLLDMDETKLQGLLDAHPKIIANRGRLGWGIDDNRTFAPESLQQFQLDYVAVHKSLLTAGYDSHLQHHDLMMSMMSESDYQLLLQRLSDRIDSQKMVDDFQLMPCHPWQYQHKIYPQFQWAMQQALLIHLGQVGDYYQPQQSIRTLSNVSRPQQYDVKLAITILNTSCYRGVPERFIAAGHHISQWLTNLSSNDSLLRARNFKILQESAGCFVQHQYQQQISQAPYRYHEMLGCIWRESSASKAHATNERHFLLSALLQKDCHGNSLIREVIQQSGLSTDDWLKQLFEVMSVPLYHLMIKYGVGVIAHGQNVVVYLKNSIPHAVAIKDFHGDLRLLDQTLSEQADLNEEVQSLLTLLPKEHLIHDLLTGHFISVYRFLSPLIEEQTGFTEHQFYSLLAEVIANYQVALPEYAERFEWFDLFRPRIERICLNAVRFKIGYQDNAERPLPTLAGDLENPLFIAKYNTLTTSSQPYESTMSADVSANHCTQ